ncbi:MAG TPA: TPM domain-containing protein [Myxococcota bacterium]|nr:TPM domain-containing protein [Myxococcota bacterium]
MLDHSAWNSAGRGLAALCVCAALALALALGCSRDALAPAPAIVRDDAGLLADAQRAAIESQHAFLRSDYGIDYRVEIIRGAADLDTFAASRFHELEIGSAGRGGRGLLLLIDAEADQVRLEVGRAMEGSFPDAFVAWVEQRQMVPFFRAGAVGDGILAATELLVAQVQSELASGGFAELAAEGSAGGGARTAAHIGELPDPALREGPEVPAGDSPEATAAAYLLAMRARNADPDLDLYSAATRVMLARRVVTLAQMDTLVRMYRDCRAEPVRLDASGVRAVIRYPIEARRCPPWFLVREGERWRLDLATASSAIRFGRDNTWHFAAGAAHLYAFGFADWTLDRNGYPRG